MPMVGRLVDKLVLVLAAAAGCSYHPAYEGAACGPGRSCPSGYTCMGDGASARCTQQTGTDAGTDAGDPGADAQDAGSDPGLDAGSDPGADPGIDAGPDAGVDAGADPGTDAGADAGVDAGEDAGSDPGPCAVPDQDDDGFDSQACGGDDCDDSDVNVHPGAAEGPLGDATCSDGKDNDCDGTTDEDDPACVKDWWNTDFAYRRRVYLLNGGQGRLEQVPVLIELYDPRIAWEHVEDGGADLRFVDADDRTTLPHEIEAWNHWDRAIVWVEVPVIEGYVATDFIWMYHGNQEAEDAQDPAGVWSNGYQAVYHMDGAGDATDPPFDGTDHGSWDNQAMVGRGRGFDGNASWIDLGRDRPLLQEVGGCTLSAIVTPWYIGDDFHGIVSVSVYNDGDPTSRSRAYLGLAQNREIEVGGRSADDEQVESGITDWGPIYTDEWWYLVGVVDYANGRIEIYLDGEYEGGRNAGFVHASTPDTPASSSSIGAQDDGSEDWFNGWIDEVRIADTVRSADWIRAQYWMIIDEFLAFDDEEPLR